MKRGAKKTAEREKKRRQTRVRGREEFFSSYLSFFPYPPGFPALEQAVCRGNVLPRAWEEVDLEAVSFFSIVIILNKTLKNKNSKAAIFA